MQNCIKTTVLALEHKKRRKIQKQLASTLYTILKHHGAKSSKTIYAPNLSMADSLQILIIINNHFDFRISQPFKTEHLKFLFRIENSVKFRSFYNTRLHVNTWKLNRHAEFLIVSFFLARSSLKMKKIHSNTTERQCAKHSELKAD